MTPVLATMVVSSGHRGAAGAADPKVDVVQTEEGPIALPALAEGIRVRLAKVSGLRLRSLVAEPGALPALHVFTWDVQVWAPSSLLFVVWQLRSTSDFLSTDAQ